MTKQEAEELVRKHGSNRAAARAVGCDESVIRRARSLCGGSDEKMSVCEHRDELSVDCVSAKIRTADDALKKANIDLKLWEIDSVTVNSWEVAGKRRRGQDEHGLWKPEELWLQPLWQVRVKLKRRAPKPIQGAIQALLLDLNPPRLPPPKPAGHNLAVEIALFDAHFGKLAWGASTQDGDYDLAIAEKAYAEACQSLLSMAPKRGIKTIIFPIGNDFFQADNWVSTTARGTPVDSVDDRFQRVFQVGCLAVRNAIIQCRELAPVDVVWVPGNHDLSTSWYMAEYLSAWFRKDRSVSVDASPPTRKYRQFGVNLLGYTHGHNVRLSNLPLLMASEEPKRFAEARYRAWRIGHFHKKSQWSYHAGDTFNGVLVEVLPSLSGTDQWHYDHGFVRGHRTAEAHVWDCKDGRIAVLSKTVTQPQEK
jgi:hypothetical protein